MARTPTPEQIQRRAAFAQEDLHAAERIVEAGAYSHAAFSCHQATEKYLKALWMQQR
ncbi:MAG: HEPN domain-containing protein, partial [Armatimonadota bacterium]